jgi:hypothetical protein
VLAAALTPITGLVADPVAAENPVTSCDLYVLVKEAAEPVSSERPDDRSGGCGVPEVGSGSLTSGDRWSDRIAACAVVALFDLPAGARAGPTAGPHVLNQGRRAPRAAPRSRRPAPHKLTTTPEWGRPGRVRRPRSAFAPGAALPSPGHSEPDPRLASPPRSATVDLPKPDRAAIDRRRRRRPGSADGAGEPALGVRKDPGRAAHTRPPRGRLDDPADSAAPPDPASARPAACRPSRVVGLRVPAVDRNLITATRSSEQPGKMEATVDR